MHPQNLLLFIVSSAIPLACSFSGDCETVQQLLKPITAWETPYIVSALRKSCASHFSSDAAQKWECLKMADGMVAIVENAPTDQAAINQLARSIILYSLIDPAPPARSNFIVEAQLDTWGSVGEFLDCNALNSASSPYFQARNTELVMAPDVSGLFEEPFIGDAKTGQFITQEMATPTSQGSCSDIKSLVQGTPPPIVKDLTRDCLSYFSTDSKQLLPCLMMVDGMNTIITKTKSVNTIPSEVLNLMVSYLSNGLFRNGTYKKRESFIKSARLGKWGTLRQFINCAIEPLTPTTTTAITTTPSPTTSSHRGNCLTIEGLLKHAKSRGTPPIVKYLTRDCERAFVNANEIGQLSKCLDMVDGLPVILSFSSSQQQLPLRVKHWIMAYIDRYLNSPTRQKFLANATLGKWGTLKQFLTCAGELPISTTPVPTTTTPSTTTNKCSELAPLLNSPVQGSFAPIVHDIRLDCASCFSESTEPQKYAHCMTMANGVDAIVTSSVQKSEIPMEVKKWLYRYELNDPSPPTRENFINQAPLGKWGTLKQFIDCSEKSTTTTPTTTTAATTTTTAIDRCLTVGEQVKSTTGERSPLYEAIWRAGVKTPWFHLLHKLLLKALANRIQIALEHAPQPQNSSQLVQAANDVLVAWIYMDPHLKEHLVSIRIGEWGTVCDFLHCVSATYPCTTAPSTTTTPSSRWQIVSDTIGTVGQTSPLSTAITDACNQPPTCSPFNKMLFMSLLKRIDIALNQKPDANVTQKLQMVKKIIIDWQNDNPKLKPLLENTKIDHWGTVGEFLNCPS